MPYNIGFDLRQFLASCAFRRLIELYAGDSGILPRCTLFQIDLESGKLHCKALSYVWGESGIEKTILVNSQPF
jgi:hypothetical protein